jgi:site-specific recombinase XerD
VTGLAPTLQAFFTQRLISQRGASPNTIAGYRDTWRLLLGFAAGRTGKTPWLLDIADLDAPLIGAFLDDLETGRGNTARTRNNRLAAIRSMFGWAALRHPEHADTIARVLAITPKRCQRNLVTYLTAAETDALAAACDKKTWTGRRDHSLIVLAVQAGLRISELAALTVGDVVLGAGAHVHVVGKGRKERRTPLLPVTVAVLRAWIAERGGAPGDPLFPTSTGRPLSRDAIERRISLHAARAAQTCLSIRSKHVTAHVLRHSCAMNLLQAGNDVAVIALFLGHEQVSTTSIYLHADMRQKERAIARAQPPNVTPGRYRAPDKLLAFLEAL